MKPDEVRDRIRQGYGASSAAPDADGIARRIGYSDAQLASLPEHANLGFGCGNPTAAAGLGAGEVVVDLGSGAGVDVFLAARALGPTGRAIGIDMTPHMLEQARAAAERTGLTNVEFREAAIESLPLDDASVDVVISNGVINLSPEREGVLEEVHRVLRPGGRVAIADLAIARAVAPALARVARRYLGTLLDVDGYTAALRRAGLVDVKAVDELAYGRLVLAANAGFRAAAAEDGVSGAALERFFGDLTAPLLTARKPKSSTGPAS